MGLNSGNPKPANRPNLKGIPGQDEAPWVTQFRATLELNSIAANMRQNEFLAKAKTIFFASDYGGEDQNAAVNTYTFLMVSYESLNDWFSKVRNIHQTQFSGIPRTMEYKKLRDAVRVKALPEWLNAGDRLQGYLVTFFVPVGIDTLFGQPGSSSILAETLKKEGLGRWTSNTAEKLLRILHVQSVLCATVLKDGQKLFWMMDDDSIFPNEEMGPVLGRLWERVLTLYLPQNVRPSKVGFAKPFHSAKIEDRIYDDALTYTDLVAGAVQEYFAEHSKGNAQIMVKESTSVIIRWLANHNTGLKRINIRMDSVIDNGVLKLQGNLVTFNLQEKRVDL